MPLHFGPDIKNITATVEYWWYPYFPKGSTLLLSAPQKSMKSFAGLQFAQSIATGKEILGHETERGKVLYIDFELGDAEAKSRYTPMEAELGETRNFMLRTRDEEKLSLDETGPGFRNLRRLVEKLRDDGNKPDIIFFDTLRMSHSMQEGDSTDMMKVFTKLRELKMEFELSAVLIHHDTKPDEHNKTHSRGSSVIEDVPESLGQLTCNGCHDAPDLSKPPKVSISWRLRNHAPVTALEMQFDAVIGLFVPIPQKKPKEPATSTASTNKTKKAEVDVVKDLLQPASGVWGKP